MGFRPIEKWADLNPVTANGKATADLPPAGTYYAIYLECLDGGVPVSAANIAADIQNVKVTLDGRTVYEISGVGIQKLYEHHYAHNNSAAPIAGCLPLLFAPDFLSRNMDSEVIAWGMADQGVIQVEVDFGALVNTAGHIDQVAVYTERTQANRPLGTHRQVLRFERSFASAGDQEIVDLPVEKGDVVTAAFHILYDGSAAVINQFEVIANNNIVMNLSPTIAQQQLEKRDRKFMVAAAANDLFSVPFDLSGDLNGFLPHVGLNDLRLRVNWSAAPGAYTIIRESYHGVGKKNV